jgi:predicted Mrr-cat superfamily restriction endonuclease
VTNIYCVRGEFGTYTQHFLKGGYAAIGWLPNNDLSKTRSRDELYPLYKLAYPEDTSNVVIGQQVGQIARFLLDITAEDYVIVPDSNTDLLYYGVVQASPYYFEAQPSDSCDYRHRLKITWKTEAIRRSEFSVPFQNTMRSSLTVFKVNHSNNFFSVIGRTDLIPAIEQKVERTYYEAILERILNLDAKEFEILITHILTALGFEGSEHTGKVGDGGVDATGELNVANMAKIKLFVQAKRYQLGKKIDANTVKSLRSNIPAGGQGAFITTADFQKKAFDVALEVGFPRIGLINGEQLVDILAEHWADIPDDFKEKLNLKIGLVSG